MTRIAGLAAVLSILTAVGAAEVLPEATEAWEPVPAIVTPGEGAAPPSDAIVLFDGKNLDAWQHENGSAANWKVADGAVTVAPGSGDIYTRQRFGDVQLHVEWRTPAVVEGHGQERGNSGVYLQSRYEVQVLDSYDNVTYSNGQAGAVYKQSIPLVNASRAPGEWQSYDIVFRAPRFGADGALQAPAVITVFQNGVLVQDHFEILGATTNVGEPVYQAHGPLPLMLQDHHDPVSYRNIWLRELKRSN